MNESILPVTPGLLELLSKNDLTIAPFSQEVFLLDIVIAGTSYCKEIETIEDQILPEKVLTMKRDPGNQYDKHAIAIFCDAIRVGFVPAKMNLVCSRLMDAGKVFFCRVTSTEWKGSWLKIKANVYMVE
jgi:hypothetical protein